MMGLFMIILIFVIPGQFIYADRFYLTLIDSLEHNDEKKLLKILGIGILSIFFLAILYSYLIAYTYILVFFFWVSTLSAIIVWFFLAFGSRARKAISSGRTKTSIKSLILYIVIACLVFPSSYILPFYGSELYNSGCDAIHRQHGNRINAAIQRYRNENGKFPEDLDLLIPEYLPNIPAAVCFPPFRFFGLKPNMYGFLASNHDYKIISCSRGTFLVVEDMDHKYPQVMNLDKGIWSYLIFDTLDYRIEYMLCGPQ